jgi:hypothetical protein
MRFFRHHLTWMLCVWLGCQASALAAPAVLAALGSAPIDELCTCTGDDHTTCPMHGSQHHPQDPDTCRLHSSGVPVDAALLSMASGAGVLPRVVDHAVAAVPPSRVVTAEFPALDTDLARSTPPPRS